MTTTALATFRKPPRAIRHQHSLARVLAWELRRWQARRFAWLGLLITFGCFFLVLWSAHTGWGTVSTENGRSFDFTITKTSIYGLLTLMPLYLILFGLLLPFVNTEGVARELKRRTHELLMTTPVATWAYVWGRYLSCLLASLRLALLLLAAILLEGLSEHAQNANSPLPQIGPTLAIWAALVLPVTVLLSSVSFALGTWFPQRTTLLKIGVVVIWFLGNTVLRGNTLPMQPSWNPLSIETSSLLSGQNLDPILIAQQTTSNAAFQDAWNRAQNQLPDLWPWLLPHLCWAVLGLALVLLVAVSFKRFSDVLT